jgi:hypothetical protein
MQRSSRCFAEPGPYQAPASVTAPALQRTAPQGLRAALRPGHQAFFPKEKSRLAAGLSFSLTALTQISSDLAVLLALTALLTLAALTVRILLLLAGLLAAALLLAGLLTRVLILLARILVLIGHSGSPYLRCSECNGKITAKARIWFPKNLGSGAIIAWRRFVLSVALEPAKNYPCTAA